MSGVLLRELRGPWRFLETGPVRPRGEANVLPVTAGEPGREEGGDWGAKKKNFATTKTKISKLYK